MTQQYQCRACRRVGTHAVYLHRSPQLWCGCCRQYTLHDQVGR